ncbi:MAG: LytTR family DNA-binding domain-containing protein [Bacteroidetes bacterium]|jgi:two-component system LytT family response regulator|nr:LytTR family DNA-binding domain-containing protein [Bacteroidota bacterium]
MPTAIIIDDVAQARQTLKEDIEIYCPNIEIVGEAEGVVSGAKLLRKINADVVFLDIQMNDGSGFDLLEILPEINFKIIFTTASDAHAIRAFRFSAIDYLMKPIDPDELVEAVNKAANQLSKDSEKVDLLLQNLRNGKPPSKLALHTLEKIHVVEINNILRCESSGNYTIFYFSDRPKLLVTKTLKEYDKLLGEYSFLRVHQSHLINSNQIKEFVKIDGGYIVMHDGIKIPVSVRKRASIVKMLDEL